MKRRSLFLATAAAALPWKAANATPTPEEIARLGKDLTPWGAEVAGNADGSIPAYTGAPKAPANFKPNSGRWADPYPDDKPVFSITAQNYQQYAAKLTEGQKEMFRRHADYRMDVYPTRRSVSFPKWYDENSIKNASRSKTAKDGNQLIGAFGGIPFPIPKTGIEVFWNQELRYKGIYQENGVRTWLIDASGKPNLAAEFLSDLYYPYSDPEAEAQYNKDGKYYQVYTDYARPASRVGEVTLFHTFNDYIGKPSKGWGYNPGTRRVRTTPDLAYDTPCPGYNGAITMDDIQLVYGAQDRFDWKLIGKAEFYTPYNNYKSQYEVPSLQQLGPKFPKPEYVRFELHRFWVAELTPKPGVRHIYSKKRFYLDEDMAGSMMETYDQAGKLFRMGMTSPVPMYDLGIPYAFCNWFFDFSTGVYIYGSHPEPGTKGIFFPDKKKMNPQQFTPEYLQANGVR